MRGAYGKPTGKVARVNIGQPIMSIRAKDAHKDAVVESLRRSKFKVINLLFLFHYFVTQFMILLHLFLVSRNVC